MKNQFYWDFKRELMWPFQGKVGFTSKFCQEITFYNQLKFLMLQIEIIVFHLADSQIYREYHHRLLQNNPFYI
jgi:hypothetical protein